MGDTPLHFAAVQGNVRAIFRRGRGHWSSSETGYTPLHYAVEHERLEAERVLLERGDHTSLRAEIRASLSGVDELDVRPMPHFVLSAVAALTVASVAATAAPPEQFEFDAKFVPAFRANSHLKLRSSGNSASLTISISGESASVPVESAVAAEFLRDATGMPVTKKEQYQGLDGIGVQMRLQVAGKQVLASKVWSPTKDSAPTEDALMRALYKVTERSRVPASQAEYLEQLYGYFDDIQPRWKVLGGKPLTVRFYARLSSDDIPAFRSLVVSLPSDREAIFDVTNLDSTGTLFHDEFVKATKKLSIKWRARRGWAEELAKMGIPKDRIIHTKA